MTSSSTSSTSLVAKPKLYALGRIFFFLLLCVVAASIVAGRASSAEARRKLLGLGAGMIHLFDGPETGMRTTLVLNGQRLAYGSGGSERGIDALLDEAEARCVAGKENLILGGNGKLRDQEEGRGYVACLAGEIRGLSHLGRPTYFYAEKKGQRTRWLSLEVDGVLDLEAMFPKTGDAPGFDLGGVPRPEGSRRILCSYGEGYPYALTMFSQAGDPAGGAARYREALARAGWTPVGDIASVPNDGLSFASARGHRWISVTLVPDGQGKTIVVVLGDHGGAV